MEYRHRSRQRNCKKEKRKLQYYSNIFVVSDKHEDNEGKVFLFKFGKKNV